MAVKLLSFASTCVLLAGASYFQVPKPDTIPKVSLFVLLGARVNFKAPDNPYTFLRVSLAVMPFILVFCTQPWPYLQSCPDDIEVPAKHGVLIEYDTQGAEFDLDCLEIPQAKKKASAVECSPHAGTTAAAAVVLALSCAGLCFASPGRLLNVLQLPLFSSALTASVLLWVCVTLDGDAAAPKPTVQTELARRRRCASDIVSYVNRSDQPVYLRLRFSKSIFSSYIFPYAFDQKKLLLKHTVVDSRCSDLMASFESELSPCMEQQLCDPAAQRRHRTWKAPAWANVIIGLAFFSMIGLYQFQQPIWIYVCKMKESIWKSIADETKEDSSLCAKCGDSNTADKDSVNFANIFMKIIKSLWASLWKFIEDFFATLSKPFVGYVKFLVVGIENIWTKNPSLCERCGDSNTPSADKDASILHNLAKIFEWEPIKNFWGVIKTNFDRLKNLWSEDAIQQLNKKSLNEARKSFGTRFFEVAQKQHFTDGDRAKKFENTANLFNSWKINQSHSKEDELFKDLEWLWKTWCDSEPSMYLKYLKLMNLKYLYAFLTKDEVNPPPPVTPPAPPFTVVHMHALPATLFAFSS
jgi:hypothetical protein